MKAAQKTSLSPCLDPEVIGPLLIWEIRMADDFADDILCLNYFLREYPWGILSVMCVPLTLLGLLESLDSVSGELVMELLTGATP